MPVRSKLLFTGTIPCLLSALQRLIAELLLLANHCPAAFDAATGVSLVAGLLQIGWFRGTTV
jgi:hypothetical protein